MSSPATQSPFDAIALREGGREVWSARDLMPKLGYKKWERVPSVLERAMAACQNSGHEPQEHFRGASKPSKGGNGAVQMVEDFHLTRYAAYLVAMNGDPRKPEIAAAQTYFAIKTREAETASVQRTQAVVQMQQPDRTRVEIPGITKPVENEKAVQPSVVEPDPSIQDPLMATMQVMMALRQEQLGMNAEIQGLRQQVDSIQQGMSAASEAISALPAPTEDAPEMTMPARCRQMVDLIVGLSGRTHHQIWREAYREYELRLGVMLQKRVDNFNEGKRPKDQISKLEWIDKHGSIKSFYSILSQMRDKLNSALAR